MVVEQNEDVHLRPQRSEGSLKMSRSRIVKKCFTLRERLYDLSIVPSKWEGVLSVCNW